MSEGNTSPDEHPIEPRDPQIIAPRPRNPLTNLAEGVSEAINGIMATAGIGLRSISRNLEYDELSPEDKKVVDAMMEKLQPELEEKAKALLAAEIRDRIVRRGDFVSLEKMLKKGKKLSVKRKRGCIYLQFGTGDPEDPIEEFLVAST